MFERFTDRCRAVVADSCAQARLTGHRVVGTEHLLLALLADEGCMADRILTAEGVDRGALRADIVGRIPARRSPLAAEDVAALSDIGIDVAALMARLEATFGAEALRVVEDAPTRWRGRWLPRNRNRSFDRSTKKSLELALREALQLGDNFIGTEHLLLGLSRQGQGIAAQSLRAAGMDLERLRQRVKAGQVVRD